MIPVRNARATLAGAVESVFRQSLSRWELLVVDDGSTDGSTEMARHLVGRDERARLICLPPSGVAEAMSAGVAASRGEWIARVDADDSCHPQRLEKQLEALRRHPDWRVLSCLAGFVGDRRAARGYATYVDWANRLVTPQEIALNRFVDLPVPNPTLMFRRQVWDECGGCRQGDFPEDFEMVLRWIESGVVIGKVPEELYQWRDSPGRASRSDPRYRAQAFDRVKAPFLARAIEAKVRGRDLWIWGAGRGARRAAGHLEAILGEAAGFVDIDPKKIGRLRDGRPVVLPQDLPARETALIVGFVGSRGAGEEIRQWLIAAGRIEGDDFWIAK